ncbi:biopolymer transporter [Hahella sp. CCB-MM4]|uniref:ExbD/TolR family protein n=1 Tax=Hahella sp. (strain CCB-MM4) TaxID=1926491 RepID=UPI000B9A8401|nr:biopolymer transporter ExbD [Hahella sp. CCB-MM4]OZG73160.1 biopolymer transporter [Hahella sp. CCB-MM4]
MKKFDQINVIPFIDIMLVLLAIVLTTATFVVQGRIPVTLPESQQVESPTKDNIEITLTIASDESIYWNDEAIDLESLNQRLKGIETQPIKLLVDAETVFRRFVEVTDILKQQSFNDVSILAKRAS